VNPISVMGASKRVAELALIHAGHTTRMIAIRLGNVLGTDGSVLPLFLDQIRNGGPVTVTDPKVTRYFLTLDETVELILSAARQRTSGIFVPRLSEPVSILEMAHQLIRDAKDEHHNDVQIEFIGLRAGDKLTEEFLYSSESTEATNVTQLLRVVSGAGRLHSFNADIEIMRQKVYARDLSGAIEVLCCLVPEYRPTETLIRLSHELTA
jgi:FlaA1/EpsC-like NDP-sugar epimerase